MANKKTLEQQKAVLTKRLADNSKIFLTSPDGKARVAAQTQSESDLVALENINKRLKDLASGKVDPKQTVQAVAKETAQKRFAENVPVISEDVLADLNGVPGLDLTNAGTFAAGGIGSDLLVYFGETKKTSGLTLSGGKPVTNIIPTTKFKTTVITDFWNDEALQNKIVSAYAAKGKQIGRVEAYGIWQQLVNTAAEIYQGGRGAKVTPLQLLTDTLRGVKGKDTGPDVSQFISVKTDDEIKQTLKSAIFSYIQKEPKDNDPIFSKLVTDIKNLYAKGTTQTSTVNPKTGKRTVVEKGGVTSGDIEARIKRAYKGTDDFLEAKSLEGADLFSQWMRS